MIHALLFELEGVLIDSSVQRRRALQDALAGEGLTVPDSIYEEHCAGRSGEAAVASALRALGVDDDALAALLELEYSRHFARHAARGVLLAPGAVEFLESARSAARVAAVTRATRREAELMLAPAGLDTAFDCLICSEDAAAAKPSPAPYEAAIARLGRRRTLDRRHTIALEDGPDGVRAAMAAGVRCIAVGAPSARQRAGAAGAIASIAGETPSSLDALLARAAENAA